MQLQLAANCGVKQNLLQRIANRLRHALSEAKSSAICRALLVKLAGAHLCKQKLKNQEAVRRSE
jgi:hypothetical protein